MLLRLSRLSFWLAAVAAALALLAPAGHEALLTATSSFACLAAVGLWRTVAKEAARDIERSHVAPPPAVIEAPCLLDAAALLLRGVRDAAHPDLALHAAARVLRNELGAAQARVHVVHEVREDQAILSDLTEAQPGFRTAPRALRLGHSPTAQALRSGREAGGSPGDAAVPVLRDQQVIALIVLEGIDLPIDARALTGLLELARLTLSQFTAVCPAAPTRRAEDRLRATPAADRHGARAAPTRHDHPNVLVVEDSVVQPEATARMLRRLGCRVSTASGMLDGLKVLSRTQFDLVLVDLQPWGDEEGLKRWRKGGGAEAVRGTPAIALSASFLPGDPQRLRELGFDDHLCKPFRQSQLLDMLNRHLPRPTPVDTPEPSPHARDGAPALASTAVHTPVPEPTVLDAGALARLVELDPTGRNQLVERVLQAFQTSVARLRPQLDTGRQAGDRDAIKHVVHTLKSSSASIGALALSTLCAETETAIRLESKDDLGPLLDKVDLALDGALAAIDTLLKARA